MENSNTLPIIEIGDTVIFRTDLVEYTRYNDVLFASVQSLFWKDGKGVVERIVNQEVFVIKGTHLLHSVDMVAQVIKPSNEVIKPTKERVYKDLKTSFIELENAMCDAWGSDSVSELVGCELSVLKEVIESLNK